MLYDDPPHRVDTYTQATTRDAGGGVVVTFTVAQSGVPCSINALSANEMDILLQDGMKVTHRIGFLASVVSPVLVRGMKIIASDSIGGQFHVRGIELGREMGGIPSLLYAMCEQQL